MRKLTPPVVAKIKALKREGRTNAEVAAAVGVSTGAVSQAYRGVTSDGPKAKTAAQAGTAPTQPALPPPAPVSGDPVSTDELRSMLSKLARGLVADAEQARDAQQAQTYQSHARQAMAAVSALAKLTPATLDEELEGAVLVTEAAIEAAAQKARDTLRRTLEAVMGAR
jgi:hypothetical protein